MIKNICILLVVIKRNHTNDRRTHEYQIGKDYELQNRISSLHRTFRKITSTINQQMHLYNFHLKHFKVLKPLRHISIFLDHHQGVSLSLAKFITYSRFTSFLTTRCCGSISCCVGICCRECSWLGVRLMLLRSIRRKPSQLHNLQQIPTQHDMLP